jgi:hypothetical protein
MKFMSSKNQSKQHYKSSIMLVFLGLTLNGSVHAESIENIANNLIYGADIVTKSFHAICIIVGVLLWIIAGSLYKAHRQNPKYVPLDRPVVYVILGFVLILIPFLNVVFGPTGSSIDLEKKETILQDGKTLDPDEPIEIPSDYDH